MIRAGTYINKVKQENKERLEEVVNGFQGLDSNGLAHLQVRGRSQLQKEIEETAQLQAKTLDPEALHRNELTLEVDEPHSDEDLLDGEQGKPDIAFLLSSNI